ncbi:MAG: hypothetical protein WA708_06570 [Acidobacteriaceae bacterium]
MKPTIIVAGLFTLVLASLSPALAKQHDYPMRVQVIHSRWHGRRGWYSGYGHGNLFAQQPGRPPKQGMDFEYTCSNPIRHTFAPDTYPARYGKNPLEIIMLLPVPGSDKGSECKTKIEMKDFVYQGGRGGSLWSIPLAGGPPTPVQEGNQDPN